MKNLLWIIANFEWVGFRRLRLKTYFFIHSVSGEVFPTLAHHISKTMRFPLKMSSRVRISSARHSIFLGTFCTELQKHCIFLLYFSVPFKNIQPSSWSESMHLSWQIAGRVAIRVFFIPRKHIFPIFRWNKLFAVSENPLQRTPQRLLATLHGTAKNCAVPKTIAALLLSTNSHRVSHSI